MSLKIMYKILHSTLYNNLHYNFIYSNPVTRAKLCFCSKQSQTLFDFVWSKINILVLHQNQKILSIIVFFSIKFYVICHSLEYFFITRNVVVHWTSHMKICTFKSNFHLPLSQSKRFSWPEDPKGFYGVLTWHPG